MKRIDIKSTTLICIVSLYFATVLNLSFWRYIIQNIQIDSPMMLIFAFSLGIFIFVVSIESKPSKYDAAKPLSD